MPTDVISKVNKIGKKENQGIEFRFPKRNKEMFDWTDEVPDNDREFQGFLGEESPFPYVSSELPGVVLKDELVEPTTALEEDHEPAFEAQAAAELDNADIQVDKQLRASRAQAATVPIVVARPNEIIHEVELGTYEPDKGIHAPLTPPPIPDVAGCGAGRYPTQSRRSVLVNLPYDRCLQFLQTSGMLNDMEYDQ